MSLLFNIISHRTTISKSCALAVILFALSNLASAQPTSDTHDQRDLTRQQNLLIRYCNTCHNQTLLDVGTVPVAFEGLSLAAVTADAEIWEAVVRKLRSGMMPPLGLPRPDKSDMQEFITYLETELDRGAELAINPGRTETYHRINRAEYRNVVRDLLGLDFDVSELLPADDASYGFDNIAGVLRFSPTLMERYLVAAKKVSRMAVGTSPPSPNFNVIRLADDLPQNQRFEELPFGTRGGILINYNFPIAGEYAIRARLARQVGASDRNIPNFYDQQQLEVSLDGTPLQVFTLAASEPQIEESYEVIRRRERAARRQQTSATPAQINQTIKEMKSLTAAQPPQPDSINRAILDEDWIVRFQTSAGPQEIAATFINRTPALQETLIEPYLRPHPSGGHNWGSRRGVHLQSVEISGPFPVGTNPDTVRKLGITGSQIQTPSREKIFICQPTDSSLEDSCAKSILSNLAQRAYRRPATEADVAGLMSFYQAARVDADFESGIEMAIRRLLVSPEFLFRIELEPENIAPGSNYEVSDLGLASRLSFFLWSSIPDQELLELANSSSLHRPEVLAQQVQRMLADPRSQAIVENFVGQWLYLRNVAAVAPDPYKDPDFDNSLREALRHETELFFESIIRENRSVVELLDANYTFLNERLAKHYDIPFVYGDHFRRVTLPAGSIRGGLLGQGSVLAVTSHANRTSPVVRGKWILENILGSPPPPPPPDVPDLEEEEGVSIAKTMRERMAMHRANPVCASCHQMMDPLGLALENFDQAGRWRVVEESFDSRIASYTAIDTVGSLPDGTPFDGPLELRRVLMERSDNFITAFTEKLLTYALGRGIEHYDMPAIRHIISESASDDYTFTALVLGVVNSIPFQMRRAHL